MRPEDAMNSLARISLAGLVGLALVGCGGAPEPQAPPVRPATVALSAPATALVGARVTVTAQVLQADGTPVTPGTAVTFVATGGVLSDVTATDAAGHASARLTSAVGGEVSVVATVGRLPSVTRAVTFIDPDEPHAVSLSAAAARADLGAQVALSALVVPAGVTGAGDPAATIADGTVVTFSTSAGVVSAVSTTVGGLATATLSGVAAPGIVWVTATAGSAESPPVLVEFTDPDLPASVALAGLPAAGFTGAQGPVSLTATVLTLAGAPVPAGSPITFAVLSGAGVLSATDVHSDQAGRATVTLTSGVEGTVLVGATATGGVTGTLAVGFTDPSRPVSLQLAANPPAGRIDGQGPVLLTATVAPADPAHGRIPDGLPVTFSITAGNGTLSSQVVASIGGVASVALATGVEGSVSVRAVAGAVADTATIFFTNPSRPVALRLAANPPAGRLDGQPPVTLTATLTPADPALGAIADGTLVTFAVASGSGTLSSPTAATVGGVATVTLTGGAEGVVALRAESAGALVDGLPVTFTNPSRPAAITLTASPDGGRTGGQRPVTLTALVTPADPALGRIADGTLVSFSITGGAGALSAQSAATSGGIASVTLDAATAGTVTVSASAGAAPVVSSAAVAVPFVTQPTLAIVTLRTTGALPAGASIGGVSALVTASPAAGLSLAASDVASSGAAAGALVAANVADVAASRLALISATGFQPGELATLTFRVAAGTFPTAQDFAVALTGPGVIDLEGVTIPLGVAIQGVTIQ